MYLVSMKKLKNIENRTLKRMRTGCPPWLSLHAWRTHPHMREKDWEEMFERYRQETNTPVSIIRGVVSRRLFYLTYSAWIRYHAENDDNPRRKCMTRKCLSQYREPFRVKVQDD
jgi:hypothetical protein